MPYPLPNLTIVLLDSILAERTVQLYSQNLSSWFLTLGN